MSHSSRAAARRIASCSMLAVVLGLAACEAFFPEDGEAIDRDTFIDTQVEVRLAAFEADRDQLPEAQRDSILAEKGVTDEELQAFLAVHGEDEAYMADLWTEVDRRVHDALGADPDDFPDPAGS